ncbi:hypothetical protein ACSBR1_037958 [Camellia fascicularis]
MEDEYLVMEFKSSSNISNKKVHHVTLVNDWIDNFNDTFCNVVSLRTFQLQYPPFSYSKRGNFLCDFRKFGSLRVFQESSSSMTRLPSSIGNLKHLRYLDLHNTDIKQLPNSICSLWNLQTLILDYCRKLERLPKNMKYLTSLRHLYLIGCPLIEMPPNIGQLTYLKTLNVFIVGQSKGCSLAELKCLNLGGQLCIKNLERVRNPMVAKEANLVEKQNLCRLELYWEYDLAEFGSRKDVESELVIEALEPHPNLKALVIQGYKGSQFPLWMRDSVLKNIVKIQLCDCKNCLQLPPFGQLPLLQSLRIDGMDIVLEYLDNDFPGGGGPVRGFPSLEVLHIGSCSNLKGLSREEGRELFPRLCNIEIGSCPLLSFPHLSSPKELFLYDECTNVVLNSISKLISLTSLRVSVNHEAVSFPKEVLRNLTLLKSLRIVSFSNLKVLPKDLASLVALISLSIGDCPELESLPEEGIQGLESLQSLHIDNCPKIASLPASIQNLTKLQSIDIWGCSPELARRCEKGKGEDWCADAMLLGHNDSMMAANFEVVVGIRCIVGGEGFGLPMGLSFS